MITLERITLREVPIQLVEPFTISSGTITARDIFLIEVEDKSGAIGWGECVAGEAPNYTPETIETAWLAIREYIAPRVLGKTFEHPRDVYAALYENFRGHDMAKAGVEMAMWELGAQMEGVPLSKYLGGTREKIGTGVSLGIQASPEKLVEKAQQCIDEGYRKIKCKIKPGYDIDYLTAVREALGPDAPVMADANNAYTLDDIEVLKQIDKLDLYMLEQPLAWDDIYRHSLLQPQLNSPICLDESITSVDKCQDMLDMKAGRIVNIKPGRVGGFTSSIAIHNLCQANDIPVWCGGMLESGIGRAHNVALASLPNFTMPGDVSPSARYWKQDLVTPEWTMDAEGYVTVPLDKPGMGVDVDKERIEATAVRTETLDAGVLA